MALLPQTLRDRLKPIGLEIQDQYFTLDQATREVVVTRHFISATYGGNMKETFPRPAPEFLNAHGMNDWMFLPTEYEPEAPLLAGAPGLWLCLRPDHDIQQIKRVFVKAVPEEGPRVTVYQYMGMNQASARRANKSASIVGTLNNCQRPLTFGLDAIASSGSRRCRAQGLYERS